MRMPGRESDPLDTRHRPLNMRNGPGHMKTIDIQVLAEEALKRKNIRSWFTPLLLITFLAACTNTNSIASTSLPTETPMVESNSEADGNTQTPAPTIPAPPSPTTTPTEIIQHDLPTGEIQFHEADETIVYNWFSYIPKSIDDSKPSDILICCVHANIETDSYGEITAESRAQMEGRIEFAEKNRLILLVPVIPRPKNGVYVVVFPPAVFSENTSPFLQRPDEKVILMIDKLLSDLRNDAFQVNDKVLMEGFSASAIFAQRFSLLHPERVKAIAAGHSGGALTFPLTAYGDTEMNWPVGIADYEELAGYEFNLEEYQKIVQFIYIGDKDVNNSTLEGGVNNTIFQSPDDLAFVVTTFGTTDPVRLQNQVDYLHSQGFNNFIFKLYPGIRHYPSSEMVNDSYYFLINYDLPDQIAISSPMPAIQSITKESDKDGMTLVFVPAGEFIMGSGNEDEYPARRVELSEFWIDQTEVTNRMYLLCENEGVCTQAANNEAFYGNFPVISVSWDQANTYCLWAGRRLPTEAEWEKAGRGVDGRMYPWGNEEPNPSYFDLNGDMFTEVGLYPLGASPYGVLDILGNVAEWVADWYGPYPVPAEPDPMGPESGPFRVIRGGSSMESATLTQRFEPMRVGSTGFRCATSQP